MCFAGGFHLRQETFHDERLLESVPIDAKLGSHFLYRRVLPMHIEWAR